MKKGPPKTAPAPPLPAPALEVISRPIGEVLPYPNNARKIPGSAVEKVAASITEFGWRQPIVVDSKGVVICGHVRLLAAQQLGLTEVPVHVAETLTKAQVKAYRLMDNRSHDETTWDFGLLGPELEGLKLDIDLALTGFDQMQIDQMLAGITTPEWAGMPTFEQADQMPWKTLKVHFKNARDREQFAQLIGQQLTEDTGYIWYPKNEAPPAPPRAFRIVSSSPAEPRYPVYIISKGRWKSRLTAKGLETLGVPYRIVVEPQERDLYAAVIDPAKILVLPFSNLGQGSIPARNWVWEHSLAAGDKRHWILDDNIWTFMRLLENRKVKVSDGTCFRVIEDFVDRYTNIAEAGMNYDYLAKRKQAIPPFTTNTRIYSNILIDNSLSERWRGRYNEDTDLSLRLLKAGYCTVLFNAFLAKKQTTMTMAGGNTDELYKGEGRLKMAQSLQEQHPDCVKVSRKFKRWQHHVDYSRFKENRFVPVPGLAVPEDPNEYGMELKILPGFAA